MILYLYELVIIPYASSTHLKTGGQLLYYLSNVFTQNFKYTVKHSSLKTNSAKNHVQKLCTVLQTMRICSLLYECKCTILVFVQSDGAKDIFTIINFLLVYTNGESLKLFTYSRSLNIMDSLT